MQNLAENAEIPTSQHTSHIPDTYQLDTSQSENRDNEVEVLNTEYNNNNNTHFRDNDNNPDNVAHFHELDDENNGENVDEESIHIDEPRRSTRNRTPVVHLNTTLKGQRHEDITLSQHTHPDSY